MMDLLQKELARKKAILDKAATTTDKSKKRKYMKQSEIRRLEEQEEEERLLAAQKIQQSKREKTDQVEENDEPSPSPKLDQKSTKAKKRKLDSEDPSAPDSANVKVSSSKDGQTISMLSDEDIKSKLRGFGLPICFFGETRKKKLERLESALKLQHQTLQGLSEMEEFRLGRGHGIRNPFLEKDKTEKAAALGGNEEKDESKEKLDGEKEDEDSENESDEDPVKNIYRYLKGLLRQWEEDLEVRPTSVAKSVAGRNEFMTFKQCKDYIRPLFKKLKRRKIEPGMQAHLEKIVQFAKEGEFVKAHDAYIDVAIGRAAWPIGVTMVGIHARSGRAKIESSNVAHVMNSELQRKFLTSVKRLLSYAQKKRTDVDPSKKVC